MIYLQLKEYEKLLAHAVKCLPEEACGLLGGKKDDIGNTLSRSFICWKIQTTAKSIFHWIPGASLPL